LYTWEEVVWEIALKGWEVTFCPPLSTAYLTVPVMQAMRSSLTWIFSKVGSAML
jgi:hypothetical protein